MDEIEILFRALGARPFNEVYELIGKINEQVNTQLGDPGSDTPTDIPNVPEYEK